MADTSNVFMNRRNPSWLNQYYATSGKVPSAGVIQEMVAGELDAAAQNRYRSKALANQQLQLDYMGRSLKNQEKTAKAGAIGDIFKAGAGALTAGTALYKGLKGDGTTTETKPTGTGFLDGITGFAKNLFGGGEQQTSGTGIDEYESYLMGGGKPYSGYENYGAQIYPENYGGYEDKVQQELFTTPKFKNKFDEDISGGGEYDIWGDIFGWLF